VHPIQVGDREKDAITDVARPGDPVASHYSLPHCPQFRDRCLASRVAKIRYKFHPPGATAKGVSKHEQLGFRVRIALARRRMQKRGSDFDALTFGLDVQEAGRWT